MRCDRLWRNARLATLAAGDILNGVVAARDERILFAGASGEAPMFDAAETIDCEGRWITPGLVDPHTHLVHGGDRVAEFERRLAGASYEEIARGGGGILSTMRATHEAGEAALIEAALPRLDALVQSGATTVEIKSGYGLVLADEIKQLRAARALGAQRDVAITTTYLAAHALPPDFKGEAERFVDHVCQDGIPSIAASGLADAVDAFCETIAFSTDQVRRVFSAARKSGLPVKLHAEQLSNQNGAALAAEFGALSADHLEYLDEAGAAAMARAGTVATLLPGAFYFTRETRPPPVELLRRYKVPIALGSDCNPGTSPLTSLLLVMNMAATLFRMTVAECLAGVTREAARALGRLHEIGTLERGKYCDLAIWDVERPAELVYLIGRSPLYQRVWHGR